MHLYKLINKIQNPLNTNRDLDKISFFTIFLVREVEAVLMAVTPFPQLHTIPVPALIVPWTAYHVLCKRTRDSQMIHQSLGYEE